MLSWTVKDVTIPRQEYLQHQELAYIKYLLQSCQIMGKTYLYLLLKTIWRYWGCLVQPSMVQRKQPIPFLNWRQAIRCLWEIIHLVRNAFMAPIIHIFLVIIYQNKECTVLMKDEDHINKTNASYICSCIFIIVWNTVSHLVHVFIWERVMEFNAA